MNELVALLAVLGIMVVFLAALILGGNAVNDEKPNISNRIAGMIGVAGCVLLALAVML